MDRFVTAIKEVLIANAGAGELLADVGEDQIYMLEANTSATFPLIIIWPFEAVNEAGHSAGYRLKNMDAEVNVYVEWDKTAADKFTIMQSAVQLADKVERVLLDNPRLVCTSYASGIIMQGERIEIENWEPHDAMVPGTNTMGYLCKLAVTGRVIVRHGAVATT